MLQRLIANTRLRRSVLFFLFMFACFTMYAAFTSWRAYLVTDSPQLSQAVTCDPTSMTDAEIANARGISLSTFHLIRTRRSLSNEAICSIPADKLARAIDKSEHPKPDRPDEALRFRRLQLQDKNGFVPSDGLVKASQHVDRMRSVQNPAQPAAGIERSQWKSIGPGNIGGRVRSIVIHPTTPSTMWLGSVSGGVWKTTNAGVSWYPLDDFMANLAVSTLAIDPTDPNVIYAGTGEGFYNADSIQGAGVFKTADGGTTWNQLASTATAEWYYTNRLTIDPNNSQILLAATGSGIWRTTNGGSSWSQVHSDWALKDVEFHASNSSRAVAGGSAGRALYSTDGGVTWAAARGLPAMDWLGRVEVAFAPSNANIVYASIPQNNGELWKSTNGGQSYTLMNSGYEYGASWYNNLIWVDPTNANGNVNLSVGLDKDR